MTPLVISEKQPPPADGKHCREMAGKIRELARYTRSPGIRRELVDLAKRYDRRGDYFDRRSRWWYSAARGRLRTRDLTPDFARRLVLAQALIHDLPQQIVIGPGQELHLGHQLGAHPMYTAEHQG
jgi:hypothetical protein